VQIDTYCNKNVAKNSKRSHSKGTKAINLRWWTSREKTSVAKNNLRIPKARVGVFLSVQLTSLDYFDALKSTGKQIHM